jgi:hypothetical protein
LVISGAVASVFIVAKSEMKNMIGMAASAPVAAKPVMNSTTGTAVSVPVAVESNTNGIDVCALNAVKHEMNSTIV